MPWSLSDLEIILWSLEKTNSQGKWLKIGNMALAQLGRFGSSGGARAEQIFTVLDK